MAPVLCRPPGDMAPGLEWVFPLCWHPLMQRLRTLQDHILTSPVLSPLLPRLPLGRLQGGGHSLGSRVALGPEQGAGVLPDRHPRPLWAA